MAFHRFLLRLCGRAPDALMAYARHSLAQARHSLADYWLNRVAKSLAFAAHAGRFSVTAAEACLLVETLSGAGEGWSFVADLPVAGGGRPLPFLAVGDGYFDDGGHERLDRIDQAALKAVVAEDDTVALWRAWRVPAVRTLYPEPKRVFLVQAAVDADAVVLASKIQQLLTVAGERYPLVEVFDEPQLLPEFSRRALRDGDLLWADRPAPAVRLALTFDAVAPDGTPAFGDDRLRLSRVEADRVAAYLDSGVLLVSGDGLAEDILSSARRLVVPTGLRGDGRWVWSEAASYYVGEHCVAPDEGLLAAIRAAEYAPSTTDPVSVYYCRVAFSIYP
jgi:hypothetical protein